MQNNTQEVIQRLSGADLLEEAIRGQDGCIEIFQAGLVPTPSPNRGPEYADLISAWGR